MQKVVIGIGSNLGSPAENVARAIATLHALPGLLVKAKSSLWRTAPVGGPPQGDYCNAAVLGLTDLPPIALLRPLLAIEQSFGRVRPSSRNEPRTLDLDLLWMEGIVLHTADLDLPHPRLGERAFALVPLLEVAQSATDPRNGEPYSAILARIGRAGIVPWNGAGKPPLSGSVADS